MNDPEEICAGCKFAIPVPCPSGGQGLQCRRRSPIKVEDGHATWIFVKPEDWCGEFQYSVN